MYQSKTKYMKVSLLILSTLCFLSGCGGLKSRISTPDAAASMVENARIEGYVYAPLGGAARTVEAHAGLLPLQGAVAHVEGTNVYSTTDENGHYILENVPVGEVTVTISKEGHQSISRTVTTIADTTVMATLEMSEQSLLLPQENGSLSVTSTPASATIYIDSMATSLSTPETIEGLSAATHSITVSLQGYATPTEQIILITADATAAVAFQLSPFVCSTSADCDDENSLTIDTCNNPEAESAACSNTPFACNVDSDCDDGSFLTADSCSSPGTLVASCSHTQLPSQCIDHGTELSSAEKFFLTTYLPWFTLAPDYEHWEWFDRQPGINGLHSSAYTPIYGIYDSTDQAVLNAHMMQFMAGGLNIVNPNWYGRNTTSDRVTAAVLNTVDSLPCDIGFAIMTDAEPYRWNYDYNDPARKQLFMDDMLYLADNYLTHPNYIKINGAPVILHFRKLFDDGKGLANPIMDITIPIEWWDELHNTLKTQRGYDFAFIPLNGFAGTDFQGHATGTFTWIERATNDPDDYGQAYLDWVLPHIKWMRTDLPDVPLDYFGIFTVFPGFNDSGVYAWTHDTSQGRIMNRTIGGQKTIDISYDYIRNFNTANPTHAFNTLMLATFNDWNEGTQMEASQEFGLEGLKDTARLANDFGVNTSTLTNEQWNAMQTYLSNLRNYTDTQRNEIEHLFLRAQFDVFVTAVQSYTP